MEILYLLIPISVLIVFLAVWIFLRMSSAGQFDDMEGPAYRILLDDDMPQEKPESSNQTQPRREQG